MTSDEKPSQQSVKLGQVYRALHDVPVLGNITYRAPASGGFYCTLPAGTRIVVENNPPLDARGIGAMPLNYGELEQKLVPQENLNEPLYEGYGMVITFESLATAFVREDLAQIRFDDDRAQKHWELILKHNPPSRH